MEAENLNVSRRMPTEMGAIRRASPVGTAIDTNILPVRDRVQWGPIAAGAVSGLITMLVLTVLGLAIGASAFEPGTDLSDWDTWAGVWGGVSALVAFFLGGWIAARTAAVGGTFAGLMNGLMAALATILGLLIAAALGLDNALGFLGGNLSNLANFTNEATTGGEVASTGTFDDIERGAWGTLLALVLGLGAAAFGGYLGHNKRRDLIEGTG